MTFISRPFCLDSTSTLDGARRRGVTTFDIDCSFPLNDSPPQRKLAWTDATNCLELYFTASLLTFTLLFSVVASKSTVSNPPRSISLSVTLYLTFSSSGFQLTSTSFPFVKAIERSTITRRSSTSFLAFSSFLLASFNRCSASFCSLDFPVKKLIMPAMKDMIATRAPTTTLT